MSEKDHVQSQIDACREKARELAGLLSAICGVGDDESVAQIEISEMAGLIQKLSIQKYVMRGLLNQRRKLEFQ